MIFTFFSPETAFQNAILLQPSGLDWHFFLLELLCWIIISLIPYFYLSFVYPTFYRSSSFSTFPKRMPVSYSFYSLHIWRSLYSIFYLISNLAELNLMILKLFYLSCWRNLNHSETHPCVKPITDLCPLPRHLYAEVLNPQDPRMWVYLEVGYLKG